MKRFVFISLLLLTQTVHAQTDSLPLLRYHLSGYIKALPSLTFDHIADDTYGLYIIHNRINQKLEIGEQTTMRLEMRNRLFTGDYISLIPGYADLLETDKGLVDLTFNWLEEDELIGNSTFDRAQVDWYGGKWEVTLGRQRINWGVHTVWNPNDWFNSFNFLDFDYVERPGSDAVRVQYNLGNSRKLELAVAPGKLANDDVVALRYGFHLKTYDIQLLGGLYKDNAAAGLGFAGNLGNAGWKGELSWFRPYGNFADTSGRISLTTGFDYIFSNGIFAQVGWLYNKVTDAPLSAGTFIYTSDARQLMPFEHTVMVMASYAFNPLLNANAAILWEPEHNSLIVFPTLAYSLGDNLVASAILQLYAGEVLDTYQVASTSAFVDVKWNWRVK